MERPFWRDWASATIAGLLILVVYVLAARAGARASFGQAASAIFAVPAVAWLALIAGSATGVWLAGMMGWKRRWLAGALLAGAAASILAQLLSTPVG